MTLKFEEIFEKKPVKNFLKMLKKEQQIIQQVSKISSIITIVNYDQYQEKDSEKSNRVYNRRATEEQQKDTNNNVNKENNENNTIRVPLKDGTFFIKKITAWCVSNPSKRKTLRANTKAISSPITIAKTMEYCEL